MKILVNASVLDSRGAFSVVNSFVSDLHRNDEWLKKNTIKIDLLVANRKLLKYSNDSINIYFITDAKKGLFNKWKYERKTLPQMIKNGKYDLYFSMQNYILKNVSIRQFVLMHQPIPFSDLSFSEIKFTHWLKYKILFTWIITKQKNNVAGSIVQTIWMKEALVDKFGYKCPILVLKPPVTDIKNNDKPLRSDINNELNIKEVKLFYPTNNDKYKNNEKLIEAVNYYNITNDKKVILFITLDGKSTDNIKYIGKYRMKVFTRYIKK